MAVTAKYHFKLDAEDAPALGYDLLTDPTGTHTIGSSSGSLTASTTPAVSAAWSDRITLTAGAATIDLTALTRGNGTLAALSMSGLKVVLIKIFAATANTAVVKFTNGAANGYNIFGAAGGDVSVPAGGMLMFYGYTGLAAVSATVKNIDVTSSDTDAIFDIIIVGG